MSDDGRGGERITASPAGTIPDGEADGLAVIAPGTTFTDEIAKAINFFAWKGKVFDLRVEDSADPIVELRRLLHAARTYRRMTEGDDLMTVGKVEEALVAYRDAETMSPNNDEAIFWHAATLAAIGRVDESLPLFAKCFKMNPNWRELVKRLPASDLLPADPALMERILSIQ